MLSAPQSSQSEPQNLTTSQVTSAAPIVMVPPHHAPWHLHPQPLHIMYPQSNPVVSQGGNTAPPPPPSSAPQQPQQQVSEAGPDQQGAPQSSQIPLERLNSAEHLTQIAAESLVDHSIWSSQSLDSGQNGIDSDYGLGELQKSASDTALNNLEIADEEIDQKPKIKKEGRKKRKLADLLAEGIDPTKLEENSDQVRDRFDKGCECDGDNCFKNMNPEFVFRHRLNIAELTKNEHDLYLMGVTMACLANPEETSRHKERKRLRASYVFQGKKVCLDAFLYLENCTHYQLKAIRKHVMANGVTPRVHGNHGKKPPNTFPLDTYQHAAAFLHSYIARYSPNGASPKKPNKSGKSPPVYLPTEITRKKIHNAYKEYCEHFEPDVKVMGYSSFRHFMKEQFPNVKFFRIDKKPERNGVNSDDDEEDNATGASVPAENNNTQPEQHNRVENNPPIMHHHPPHDQVAKEERNITPTTTTSMPQIPIQSNIHQGVSVAMPPPPHPISSNYQTYTHVQLPLNLQAQQPLYSACMQPGLYPPGQVPHPPPQVRPTGFPYTNIQ